MLEVKNKTPFEVAIAPAMDVTLNEYIVVVVKATYKIENNSHSLKVADEQLPIYIADDYYDEPDNSSVKNSTDGAMIKSGTDIILNGSAYNFNRTSYVDTLLKVANIQKYVRVFGNRYWEKAMGGWRISQAESFETLPLVYENAFGGTTSCDDEHPQFFEKNPVGKGFYLKRDKRGLEGFPLPNLENPQQSMSNWLDQQTPACFAAVASHWLPRKAMAGTYDSQWDKKRKPYLPLDFNENYFNAASEGLMSHQALQGGEMVECYNLCKHQSLKFILPKPQITARYSMKQRRHELPEPQLDTVVIEPESENLSMVWRVRIPCNQALLYCDWISVRAKL